MPRVRPRLLIFPSTGISLCHVIVRPPSPRKAGLNVPMSRMPPPAPPRMAAIVGRARWVTSREFSVVNSSSNPVGSVAPAPTPREYSSESFEFQLLSCQSDHSLGSFASGFRGIGRPLLLHAGDGSGLGHELRDDVAELGRIP